MTSIPTPTPKPTATPTTSLTTTPNPIPPSRTPTSSPISTPAPTTAQITVPGHPLTRALVTGVCLVLALDLAGAVTAVSLGLNANLPEALGNTARLSAPLPMMVVQALLLFAATRRPRALAIPATALLAISGFMAFMSGFFDGAYAEPLAIGPRLCQIVLVTAYLALSFIAVQRIARILRH